MFDDNFFNQIWYKNNKFYWVLLPLSWLFCMMYFLRLKFYQYSILTSVKINKPVIIIGNISVGGTGKTILIIALAKFLKQSGFKPGIISRGYKGKSSVWPLIVTRDSDPTLVGDEPVLLSFRTNCPVVVAPSRVDACHTLLNNYDCDVILSDDGLQHYHLKRDIEIAVIDGNRLMGNNHCLPAGPLREPKARLNSVDKIVIKNANSSLGIKMDIKLMDLYNIVNQNKTKKINEMGKKIHAIAGIGNPQGFFQALRTAGLEVIEHKFADHHNYQKQDFSFNDNIPVIVTEKDAVKIKSFQPENIWVLPVAAQLPNIFYNDILNKLHRIKE